MGSKKRLRKLYERPLRLWDKDRIELETKLKEEYGLKNSRELWRMQTILRKIRREARRLLSSKGADLEKRKELLLSRVRKFLVKKQEITLDDILALQTRDILERRLETVVVRKHMAKTAKMARQYLTHGHVAIGGQVVSSPSYLVSFEEEGKVAWNGKPLYAQAVAEKPAAKEEAAEEKKPAKESAVAKKAEKAEKPVAPAEEKKAE